MGHQATTSSSRPKLILAAPGVATASKCQPQQQLSTLARINFGPHVTDGTPGNHFILAAEVDPRSTRGGDGIEVSTPAAALNPGEDQLRPTCDRWDTRQPLHPRGRS